MIDCGMSADREALANLQIKTERGKPLAPFKARDRKIEPPKPRNVAPRRNGTVLEKTCWRCKRGDVPYYRAARQKDGFDDVCCDCRIEMSLQSRRRDMETVERYREKQRVWWRSKQEQLRQGEMA